MRLSAAGFAALVREEGLRLEAYPDPASGGEPFTIGIGCTTYKDGSPVKPGDVLTNGEAQDLARWHIEQIEAALEPLITVPVSSGQWDAIVSLTFNIGQSAFAHSTLLKKLNSGDYAGAANEFNRWVYAAGTVNAGLTNRRKREQAMFLAEMPGNAISSPVEPISVPARIPERPAMPAPFIALAFEAISTLLPTLIRFKSTGEQGEKNAQLAEKVMPVIQAAVGAANAQEAAEKIANDPSALQAADKAVRDNYFELVEAGGGGIEGAREYSLKAAEKPLHHQPAFVISVLLLVFPLLLCFDVFVGHPGYYTPEMKTQVITAILVVISMVASFWLGSSSSSRAKDDALTRAVK